MLPAVFAMHSHKRLLASVIVAVTMAESSAMAQVGRPATPEEIALWDIDVRPDGMGLPRGSGTTLQGAQLYSTTCEGCHGPRGQGGIKDRLAGGLGTLATDKPVKTVGSYWPYATTLFDYIRRAMPYTLPGSLSDDDVYSLTAYILQLNGLLPEDSRLDAQSLIAVRMPNRNGFLPDQVFAVDNETQSHVPHPPRSPHPRESL